MGYAGLCASAADSWGGWQEILKRHGAEGVEDYKRAGYLPETLFNFLLGWWSRGDDEIIRVIKLWVVRPGGIGKAAANFDNAKLENLNALEYEERGYQPLDLADYARGE